MGPNTAISAMNTFQAAISHFAKKEGSKTALSRRLGKSDTYIHAYFNDKRRKSVPLGTADQIATALGYTTESFLALGRHILEGKSPNKFYYWQDRATEDDETILNIFSVLDSGAKEKVIDFAYEQVDPIYDILAEADTGTHGGPASEERLYYLFHAGTESVDYKCLQDRSQGLDITDDYLSGKMDDRDVVEWAQQYGSDRLREAAKAAIAIIEQRDMARRKGKRGRT